MKTIYKLTIASAVLIALTACSPKIGSQEWCKEIKQKPKGDWTGNEVKTFAENCIFKK